jgi:ABC-type sulfate transport system permease component
LLWPLAVKKKKQNLLKLLLLLLPLLLLKLLLLLLLLLLHLLLTLRSNLLLEEKKPLKSGFFIYSELEKLISLIAQQVMLIIGIQLAYFQAYYQHLAHKRSWNSRL